MRQIVPPPDLIPFDERGQRPAPAAGTALPQPSFFPRIPSAHQPRLYLRTDQMKESEMGYRGSDRNYDRWRDRDEGRRDYGRSEYDRDDRGFLDRAGDEVRSWFGDEEAERRRELDERRWARERELSGRGDRDFGETAGGGWGNQRGESWHR